MAKDMRAVRFNEKLKRLSTIVGGVGVALVVATALRWGEGQFGGTVLGWIFFSMVLILASVQMNELLASEDEQ